MLDEAENVPHISRMTLPEEIVHLADMFCSATGLSRTRVSTLAMNGGHRVDRLAEGGDVQSRTYRKALEWFSVNWPADVAWPKEIHRPVPSDAADPSAGAELVVPAAPADEIVSADAEKRPSLGISSLDSAGASVPAAFSEDAAE